MRGEIKTVGTLVDWLIGNNGATLFAICNLLVFRNKGLQRIMHQLFESHYVTCEQVLGERKACMHASDNYTEAL